MLRAFFLLFCFLFAVPGCFGESKPRTATPQALPITVSTPTSTPAPTLATSPQPTPTPSFASTLTPSPSPTPKQEAKAPNNWVDASYADDNGNRHEIMLLEAASVIGDYPRSESRPMLRFSCRPPDYNLTISVLVWEHDLGDDLIDITAQFDSGPVIRSLAAAQKEWLFLPTNIGGEPTKYRLYFSQTFTMRVVDLMQSYVFHLEEFDQVAWTLIEGCGEQVIVLSENAQSRLRGSPSVGRCLLGFECD